MADKYRSDGRFTIPRIAGNNYRKVTQWGLREKGRSRMKRIISVIAVAALMAMMLMVMAAPAFADKGGVTGHRTATDLSDCTTGPCDFESTRAGRNGNALNGPGRTTKSGTVVDPTVENTDDPTKYLDVY